MIRIIKNLQLFTRFSGATSSNTPVLYRHTRPTLPRYGCPTRAPLPSRGDP